MGLLGTFLYASCGAMHHNSTSSNDCTTTGSIAQYAACTQHHRYAHQQSMYLDQHWRGLTDNGAVGVQIWQQAFDQIIVAILIFQLLMIGLVGLKEAPIQAGLMAPLPFITVIYRSAHCH